MRSAIENKHLRKGPVALQYDELLRMIIISTSRPNTGSTRTAEVSSSLHKANLFDRTTMRMVNVSRLSRLPGNSLPMGIMFV